MAGELPLCSVKPSPSCSTIYGPPTHHAVLSVPVNLLVLAILSECSCRLRRTHFQHPSFGHPFHEIRSGNLVGGFRRMAVLPMPPALWIRFPRRGTTATPWYKPPPLPPHNAASRHSCVSLHSRKPRGSRDSKTPSSIRPLPSQNKECCRRCSQF